MIIAVLGMGVFAGAASMRVVDALLPEIAGSYGLSVGAAALTVTAYAMSYSGCQLVLGPLGDRLGPLRVIAISAWIAGFASLGCVFAPTFGWLVALRFATGAAAAAIGPLTMAWMSTTIDEAQRPILIARISAASILGATAGQAGGGWLSTLFDWQSAFYATGALFLLPALAMLAIGSRHGQSGCARPASTSGTMSGPLHLMRRRGVREVLYLTAIEGFGMYVSFTFMVVFIRDRLQLTIGQASTMVALFGVGGILFALCSRPLVNRFGEGERAAAGGIGSALGFLSLTISSSLGIAAIALLLLGVGFFLLHNVLQVRATVMAPDAPGSAMSLFAFSFFIAQAGGAAVGGILLNSVGATAPCVLSAALLGLLGLYIGRRRCPGDQTADHGSDRI